MMNRRDWMKAAAAGASCLQATGAGQDKLARPSPEQRAWQDMELEMFVHFGPATWQDAEYDNRSTPVEKIDPSKLDAGQWVEAAKSMGAGQLIFVAKHTGGFCWWQTQTTNYGAKDTPWRGGKGDVMLDLARLCPKHGLRLGVYLSPADAVFGAKVGGRCTTPAEQEKYNAVYRQQLTELLSRYGEIAEVWFDGSLVVDVDDILRRHAPRAMVFQGPHATIRWVGNEDGYAPYPAWNGVRQAAARSGVATAKDGTPDGEVWMPLECDARIRSTWFWNNKNAATLKSVEQLMSMYYRSVGHGAVLLLNHTPDTTGLIPESDIKRTAEFGAEIKRRFGKSVAEAKGTELDLKGAKRIDHAVTMEATESGERVRSYVIEGWVDGDWRELARGSAAGHKKIDAFAPVAVSRVRFRTVEAVGQAVIRRLAVYDTGAGAPGGTAAAAYSFHVLKQWEPASFSGEGPATWEMDLTKVCTEAAQYEVDFVGFGGAGLRVESLKLVHDGVEAAEFVTPAARRNAYIVNITALGVPIALRAEVRTGRGRDSFGQVTIRRAPQAGL